MKEKLIIASGTGFLGNILLTYFKDLYDVVILTRGKTQLKNGIKHIHWNAKTLGLWQHELENAAVLINLTGKSVNCRYTQANKKEILQSRLDSTYILNKAILECKQPPKHFINSSTATIYIDSNTKKMTERNGDIGNDFSMTVAKKWEEKFFATKTPNTLKTAIRTSIVLGKKGGAFIPLKRLSKFGFGGKQGNGKQLMSWIHELDFARSIHFIIQQKITGVINVTAPKTVPNQEFMKSLARNIKPIVSLPTPESLLTIGAKIIRTEPELVLKSRNVYPETLLENNFQFLYPTIDSALATLVL
ncbi:hypothetical protein SAMN05216480_101649 [Pustulibacterium marinum]|uniref:Uncharacterized protein n=1 Tax=Pustulibacterium marinum TaxID=1224947 RepID=A0A1I7F5D1_9FLAO|nr:TIGR01777 family oxidoreductase [Pustulibacterium marinum]SFU31401.1 hypothetical protein SAMN05216480_101649 [Pustulibacterium marinum]